MNEEIYITFDRYLEDEMSSEEKVIFESQLTNDAVLNETFEAYKTTASLLKTKFSPESSAFRKNLKEASDTYFAEKSGTKKLIFFKPWHYGIAASLLVFIGLWFFTQNSDARYSDYNQHETAMFVERGQENDDLKNAQAFFNAKEFHKAAASFSKLPLENNTEINYFYAITLIEIDDFSKAEMLLEPISKANSVYKYKAVWYIALSKLKQNKKEECKVLLVQIPPEAEDYAKAKELLNDLD